MAAKREMKPIRYRIRLTKRGEFWSCCEAWRKGDKCDCASWIFEFYRDGKEVFSFVGKRPDIEESK